MLLVDIAILITLGFLVGVIASMTGMGGGTFIVPALTLVYLFTSQEAVGTSLAVIVFTSLTSTYAYSRQRRIDYKMGAVLAVSTVPGAVLGAYMTTLVSSELLAIVFSVFLIIVAFSMLNTFHVPFPKIVKKMKNWHRAVMDAEGKKFEYDTNIAVTFILSFFGGLSSGLLGIGGGAVLVPILNIAAGIPIHITVATSMFIMIFTSVAGVLTHLQLNNVRLEYSAYMAIGIIFGTQLGARLAKKTSGKLLKKIISLVMLVISLRLLLNSI